MGPTATALILFSAALLSFLPAARSDTAHDLVASYGLPPGILPSNVVTYTLNNDSGEFTIELASVCYVHFSRLVYYDKHVSGKVSYGRLSDLNGVQAKELFIWFGLTGIVVEHDKGVVRFESGILSEELPIAEFETIHECKSSVAGILGPEKEAATAAVAAAAEAGAVAVAAEVMVS